MWQAWSLSSSLGQRPSALLGIEDSYVAYCLDEAIVHFGSAVEAELSKVTHKNPDLQHTMRQNRLRTILGVSNPTTSFASPAPTRR